MAESAQIQKMSAKHENILNYIMANPTLKMGDVANFFGVTQPWLSTIIHSHAFQDQLARRQNEFFDAAIVQDLGTKLTGAVDITIERYLERVPDLTPDQLISASDKLLGRLGFGTQRSTVVHGNINIQQNHNHVSSDVLKEARERIGTHKVGPANSPPALSCSPTETGTEIEGAFIRIESA